MLPTLYKMDSKGKIRQWDITLGYDSSPFYSVSHGIKGGAMIESKVHVPSGKNIGKKNETTAQEQCELEAKALWNKQVDRKGYSLDIPSGKPLRPMLAKVWEDHKHKIEYPCKIQCKLDGGRAIFSNGKLISRQGKEFHGLDHITNELKEKGIRMPLDGELYSDSLTFQEIISLIKKTKNLTEESRKIEYWVYDYIDEEKNFGQRILDINYELMNLKYTKVVPTYQCKDERGVKHYYHKFVAQGYEGAMVRGMNSKYKINGRSDQLLKLKSFIDKEFEIIGWKTGVGKFANVPIFTLVCDAGEFEATPKGTEEERAQMLSDADNLIGEMATIRYFELTDEGRPRFPVLVAIRNYE